jgi:hypothetical protein
MFQLFNGKSVHFISTENVFGFLEMQHILPHGCLNGIVVTKFCSISSLLFAIHTDHCFESR